MSRYPDDMNHSELDEPKTNPEVEEAHANISEHAKALSAAVDAAVAVLRANSLALMNEEPYELFDLLAEKYEEHIAEDVKVLHSHEVDSAFEFRVYQGFHHRKPDYSPQEAFRRQVDAINNSKPTLRPVACNPATPGFKGGDDETAA